MDQVYLAKQTIGPLWSPAWRTKFLIKVSDLILCSKGAKISRVCEDKFEFKDQRRKPILLAAPLVVPSTLNCLTLTVVD